MTLSPNRPEINWNERGDIVNTNLNLISTGFLLSDHILILMADDALQKPAMH